MASSVQDAVTSCLQSVQSLYPQLHDTVLHDLGSTLQRVVEGAIASVTTQCSGSFRDNDSASLVDANLPRPSPLDMPFSWPRKETCVCFHGLQLCSATAPCINRAAKCHLPASLHRSFPAGADTLWDPKTHQAYLVNPKRTVNLQGLPRYLIFGAGHAGCYPDDADVDWSEVVFNKLWPRPMHKAEQRHVWQMYRQVEEKWYIMYAERRKSFRERRDELIIALMRHDHRTIRDLNNYWDHDYDSPSETDEEESQEDYSSGEEIEWVPAPAVEENAGSI